MIELDRIKAKFDELVDIIKKENPNASFKNLVTGIVILVLVSVFSVWYFNSTPSDKTFINELRRGSTPQLPDLVENSEEEVLAKDSVFDTSEYVTVEKGEGLWHVAKRACGDGEKYKYLAKANNLNIHRARLSVGQQLILDCGE